MWYPIKDKHAKKQKSNEEKIQPLKWIRTDTDDRMSRQRCKIVTITLLHMSGKLVRNIKRLRSR